MKKRTVKIGFGDRLRPGLAVFLLVTFLVSPESAWAFPRVSSAEPAVKNPQPVNAAVLPEYLGRIEERYQGNSDFSVVLIHDAHGIPEAQRSIRDLIHYFHEQSGISLVGTEGASARLDAELFKSYPRREKFEEVFEAYLDRGELTGPSAAALVSGPEMFFQGMEDWSLYEKGLGLYLAAMNRESALLEKAAAIREALEVRKKEIYPPALLAVDRALSAFHLEEGKLFDALKVFAQTLPPEAGSELALLLEEGDRPDSGSAEKEVRALAQNLKDRMTDGTLRPELPEVKLFHENDQAFQTSRQTPEAFALFLGQWGTRNGTPVEFSEALKRGVSNQRRLRELEGTALLAAFENYAQSVKAALFQNEEQKNLDREFQDYEIFERFIRLEINAEQWRRLDAAKGPWNEALMAEDLGAHRLFYENAGRRDEAFSRNLLNAMKKQKTTAAMMIAGGFHARGLTEKLREAGVSYLRVTPSVEALPASNAYRGHLRGDVSWKHYFSPEGGKIDLHAAFTRAARDQLLEVPEAERGEVVKAWRDQVLRNLAKTGGLARAGNYTRYLDEISRPAGAEKARSGGRVERFLQGLRGLEAQNKADQKHILNLLKNGTIASLEAASFAEGTRMTPLEQLALSAEASIRSELRSSGEEWEDFEALDLGRWVMNLTQRLELDQLDMHEPKAFQAVFVSPSAGQSFSGKVSKQEYDRLSSALKIFKRTVRPEGLWDDAVYTIVREALTNAKQGKTEESKDIRAELYVNLTPSELVLQLRDFGEGIDPVILEKKLEYWKESSRLSTKEKRVKNHGSGFMAMHYHAALVGGQVEVETVTTSLRDPDALERFAMRLEPGSPVLREPAVPGSPTGTSVTVRIPVKARSELRAARDADDPVGISVHESMMGPLIYPRTLLHVPENSSTSRENLFEAPVTAAKPGEKALLMLQAAINEYQRVGLQHPQIGTQAKHFLNATTVLAVDLPTVFYSPAVPVGITHVIQISMRRRAILISKKFLENLDPKKPFDVKLTALYLHIGQVLLEKYDDLQDYFRHENQDHGVVSRRLQNVYRSIEQALENDFSWNQEAFLGNVNFNPAKAQLNHLRALDKELRKEERERLVLNEEQLLRNHEEIRRILSGWDPQDGYSDTEIPQISERIARIVPHTLKPLESMQQNALMALKRMIHSFQKRAFYYESEGDLARAGQYYGYAEELYKASQKIDFGGYFPLRVQEELVYFHLRNGNLPQFEKEFSRLINVHYVPYIRRTSQLSVHDVAYPLWLVLSAPDMLYKLQYFRVGADSARQVLIERIEKTLIRAYFKELKNKTDVEKKFMVDLTRQHDDELKSPMLIPVMESGDVFSFAWEKMRISDDHLEVRLEASRWMNGPEDMAPAGYLDFALLRGPSGQWTARTSRNQWPAIVRKGAVDSLVIDEDTLVRFRGIPMVLVQLALRLARESGAETLSFDLPVELQQRYGLPYRNQRGEFSSVLKFKALKTSGIVNAPLKTIRVRHAHPEPPRSELRSFPISRADFYREEQTAKIRDAKHASFSIEYLDAEDALPEIENFRRSIQGAGGMKGFFKEDYFFPKLTASAAEAEKAAAFLDDGRVLTIFDFPAMDKEQNFGFHVFRSGGEILGYLIYTLEVHPETSRISVAVAFDIYREHRGGRGLSGVQSRELFEKSLQLLNLKHRPTDFHVFVQSQLTGAVAGNPVQNRIFYLKRGFYPQALKAAADEQLEALLAGTFEPSETLDGLIRETRSWSLPLRSELRSGEFIRLERDAVDEPGPGGRRQTTWIFRVLERTEFRDVFEAISALTGVSETVFKRDGLIGVVEKSDDGRYLMAGEGRVDILEPDSALWNVPAGRLLKASVSREAPEEAVPEEAPSNEQSRIQAILEQEAELLVARLRPDLSREKVEEIARGLVRLTDFPGWTEDARSYYWGEATLHTLRDIIFAYFASVFALAAGLVSYGASVLLRGAGFAADGTAFFWGGAALGAFFMSAFYTPWFILSAFHNASGVRLYLTGDVRAAVLQKDPEVFSYLTHEWIHALKHDGIIQDDRGTSSAELLRRYELEKKTGSGISAEAFSETLRKSRGKGAHSLFALVWRGRILEQKRKAFLESYRAVSALRDATDETRKKVLLRLDSERLLDYRGYRFFQALLIRFVPGALEDYARSFRLGGAAAAISDQYGPGAGWHFLKEAAKGKDAYQAFQRAVPRSELRADSSEDSTARDFDRSSQAFLEELVRDVGEADLVITIPVYNEITRVAEAFGAVLPGTHGQTVDAEKLMRDMRAALAAYLEKFQGRRALILAVGETKGAAAQAVIKTLSETAEAIQSSAVSVKVYGKEERFAGLLGKKWALRLGMRAAQKLGGDFVSIDGDMQIEPDTVERITEPLRAGRADYVSPVYLRYWGRDDSSLIALFGFPFFSAITGKRSRMPNEGGFAASKKLVPVFLAEDLLWDNETLYESVFAASTLFSGMKIEDVWLGEKLHKINPIFESTLDAYVKYAAQSMFLFLAERRDRWLPDVKKTGIEDLETPVIPEEFRSRPLAPVFFEGVDPAKLRAHFLADRDAVKTRLKEILPDLLPVFERLEAEEPGTFGLASREWAQAVFAALKIYLETPDPAVRADIPKLIKPFFAARAAGFLQEISRLSTYGQAEELLNLQAREFAEEKARAFLSPGEFSLRSPEFLTGYREDPSLLRGARAVFVVKSSGGQTQRDERMKALHAARTLTERQTAPIGRNVTRGPEKGLLLLSSLDVDEIPETAEDQIVTNESTGFSVFGDSYAYTSFDRVIVRNRVTGGERVFTHPQFAHLHTVVYSASGKELLVTSPGFEKIFEIDAETGAVLWEWSAWDHGYARSHDGSRVYTQSKEHSPAEEPGINAVRLDELLKTEHRGFGIPTWYRAVHLNDASYDDDGNVLATLFYPGKAIKINRATGEAKEVIPGLSKPHGFHALKESSGPERYLVTNTGAFQESYAGFYDKDFRPVRRILTDDMPGRKEHLKDFPEWKWLQYTVQLTPSVFGMVDIVRSRLYLVDKDKRTYRAVKIPKEWSLQMIVPVPEPFSLTASAPRSELRLLDEAAVSGRGKERMMETAGRTAGYLEGTAEDLDLEVLASEVEFSLAAAGFQTFADAVRGIALEVRGRKVQAYLEKLALIAERIGKNQRGDAVISFAMDASEKESLEEALSRILRKQGELKTHIVIPKELSQILLPESAQKHVVSSPERITPGQLKFAVNADAIALIPGVSSLPGELRNQRFYALRSSEDLISGLDDYHAGLVDKATRALVALVLAGRLTQAEQLKDKDARADLAAAVNLAFFGSASEIDEHTREQLIRFDEKGLTVEVGLIFKRLTAEAGALASLDRSA